MRGHLSEREYWSLVLSEGKWPNEFSIEKNDGAFFQKYAKENPANSSCL